MRHQRIVDRKLGDCYEWLRWNNSKSCNLFDGKISKELTPSQLARDFIGGRGFGIYFLFKEVPKHADPLGPENKLIISTGPLSGMLVPGAGKCDWTTKSPLTGGYADASLGGHFTAEMKYAGLDTIILEGASSKPVYLFIDNDKIQLLDASSLWSKGAIDVEVELKHKYGEEYQIAGHRSWRRKPGLICLYQP